MKKTIKKLWVQALRSGKYRQGFGSLRTGPHTYCALGVLTRLYANAVHKSFDKVIRHPYAPLPLAVRQWAGLSRADYHWGGRTLIERNDHYRTSFETLAKLIDQRL